MHLASRWRMAAVVGPAAVVLLLGILVLLGLRQVRRQVAIVEQSHAVRAELQHLLGRLTDAETAVRGYLLTGNPIYLQPSREVREDVTESATRLRRLIADPSQQARLDTLLPLVDRRLSIAQENLEAAQRGGLRPVEVAEGLDRGRAVMREIRSRMGAMLGSQAALLEDRAEEEARHARRVTVLLLVGTLLSVVLALLVNTLLARYAAAQEEAAAEIEERNVQLEEQAVELETQTDELQTQTVELEETLQDLQEATEARRLADARFRALVENAQEMVAILAVDGTIRYESPAVERVLGFVPEELEGRNAFELVHPEDRDRVVEIFTRVVEDAGRLAAEFRFRHKDGSYRVLQGIATSLLADPAVAGVVVNSRDVTELRKSEERLRQAQKMEAIGQLAAGIAHDFNNVLSVIKGRSAIALMDVPADGPTYEDLAEIDQAADRAANLTRQLLAFSRQQVLQPEVLDLNQVVSELEKMLRRTLGEDIEFVTVLDPRLGRVKADPGQMEQILMNLAVNARDAMPTGGKLITETRNVEIGGDYAGQFGYEVQPGRYVLLSVSDTGTGMPREVRERIFEPFFTTKPLGSGTGMGLSTVYGIVKQSGGYIWVYSEPGQGTTFKVYLPRVDQEASPPEARPAPESPRQRAAILLVEDEPAVRSTTRRMLQRMGHTVLEAENGDQALRVAREHEGEIDLVLTDVVMPLMGGREMVERLLEIRPHLSVLYTSGYTDEAVVRHGIMVGSAAFLQKPYQPAALAEKIAEVLAQPVRRS